MGWIAFDFSFTGTTAFGFSVTGMMAEVGAGIIAFGDAVDLGFTAAFLILGWPVFLTVFLAVGFIAFFVSGLAVFFAATGFFATVFFLAFVVFTAFLVAAFVLVSVFFFVAAILTSYQCQVSGFKYQVSVHLN
jgi:hypothetical protein